KGPMPEAVLFPYPHPKSLGLILDPKERATVKRIEPESLAEKAEFQFGDIIKTLNGQPMLSIADVQYVLHRTPGEGGAIRAEIIRGGKPAVVTLTLSAGWRRADNISWRSSAWGLRRMALGGMRLEEMTTEER